mmetsp:Transcript_101239/g.291576  ORF Transcript_101239/g.291576 Transcript_101239/m.291576 type:complete len:205 (-) Transcript_101239:105-719(-)
MSSRMTAWNARVRNFGPGSKALRVEQYASKAALPAASSANTPSSSSNTSCKQWSCSRKANSSALAAKTKCSTFFIGPKCGGNKSAIISSTARFKGDCGFCASGATAKAKTRVTDSTSECASLGSAGVSMSTDPTLGAFNAPAVGVLGGVDATDAELPLIALDLAMVRSFFDERPLEALRLDGDSVLTEVGSASGNFAPSSNGGG